MDASKSLTTMNHWVKIDIREYVDGNLSILKGTSHEHTQIQIGVLAIVICKMALEHTTSHSTHISVDYQSSSAEFFLAELLIKLLDAKY